MLYNERQSYLNSIMNHVPISNYVTVYRKPPTISPGLIYFRKRFLMGLYKGGLIYGWAYTWTIFCVSNKQVRHKQGNKRVLIKQRLLGLY